MAALEVFGYQASATITAGGTDAPSSGTTETWTGASWASFPTVTTGTSEIHLVDPAAPSEDILVTNISGATASVTRGANGTTPVAHSAGFTVYQVIDSSTLGTLLQALGGTATAGNLPVAAGNGNGITWVSLSTAGVLAIANNLSDLANAATARGNLGLGTAAVQAASYFLQAANNLSDLASTATARTNLGLGTAATQASSAFDASGSAATALSSAEAYALAKANNLSDLASASSARTNLGLGTAAVVALTSLLQASNNLSDLASASTARTNLGLGAAATQALSAFLQPSNNLSDVGSASTARTNLGLGTAATQASSAFDTAGSASTAQANAEAASLPTLTEVSVSVSGTLALNKVTEVTATSGTLTMTLPSSVANSLIVCERASASTANVAVTGNIRGVGSSTVTLQLGSESEMFFGDGTTWWPVAGHKTLSSLQGLFLQITNNLSDLGSASTARTNLGLGSAATAALTSLLQASNNLSDLASASTARTNLGLGTAATQASSAFDTAGSAATAQSTAEAASVPASVMTTPGDTLYGGTAGAATRLAGNTSTAKQFFTSTGTGSAAQAPALAAIAAGDLPAATTSAQGAVKLPAASVNLKPANPLATPTTSLIMMGLGVAGSGQALTFTPLTTGKVRIDIRCSVDTETATNVVTIGPRYGTGSAPLAPVAAVVSSGTGSAAAFTATNSFAAGQQVYAGGTTQPGNFTQGTAYYIAATPAPTSSVFYLATTSGGTAIAYSSAGAGVVVGAIVTGTRFGMSADDTPRASNPGASGTFYSPWSTTDIIQLSADTAYWFDLGLATAAGANVAQMGNISVSFEEKIS